MAEIALQIEGVRKSFGGTVAVETIDLAVRAGEFLTLLGPSGCGKTTTLNLIAGFEQPDRGSIRLGGKPVEDLPPFRRDIGIVFQDYALFPHMSVAENVGFGLRMRRVDKAEIARRVDEAIELVRLPGLGGRRPSELSGGQRQRVALARALVIRPAVLLLDEPLSNLDLKLREEMRLEITTLQRKLGITTILVTHDQGEALAVSDRIAVMSRGRIEQIGGAEDLYERPQTRFVAEFIGSMNFLPGRTLAVAAGGAPVAVEAMGCRLEAVSPAALPAGADVQVAFRPERSHLGAPDTAGLNLRGVIAHQVYLGTRIELHVEMAGGVRCIADLPNDGRPHRFETGEAVTVAAAATDCRVFAA